MAIPLSRGSAKAFELRQELMALEDFEAEPMSELKKGCVLRIITCIYIYMCVCVICIVIILYYTISYFIYIYIYMYICIPVCIYFSLSLSLSLSPSPYLFCVHLSNHLID